MHLKKRRRFDALADSYLVENLPTASVPLLIAEPFAALPPIAAVLIGRL